jgi:hypothetical protein
MILEVPFNFGFSVCPLKNRSTFFPLLSLFSPLGFASFSFKVGMFFKVYQEETLLLFVVFYCVNSEKKKEYLFDFCS